MLFAIPLIVEMDYVLKLWLRTPPPFTALFCQLILGGFLIDRLTTGYMIVVNARGKIAAYQATVGISLLLTLPLAWLFLWLGYAPTSVGIAFVITSVVCTMGRVLWLRRLFGEPINRWLQTVVRPCIIVGAVAGIGAWAPHWLMLPSFTRLACASALSVVATLLATWLIAFDLRERAFFRQNSRRLLSKMPHTYGRQ
jgi:hypothetical protein